MPLRDACVFQTLYLGVHSPSQVVVLMVQTRAQCRVGPQRWLGFVLIDLASSQQLSLLWDNFCSPCHLGQSP